MHMVPPQCELLEMLKEEENWKDMGCRVQNASVFGKESAESFFVRFLKGLCPICLYYSVVAIYFFRNVPFST